MGDNVPPLFSTEGTCLGLDSCLQSGSLSVIGSVTISDKPTIIFKYNNFIFLIDFFWLIDCIFLYTMVLKQSVKYGKILTGFCLLPLRQSFVPPLLLLGLQPQSLLIIILDLVAFIVAIEAC